MKITAITRHIIAATIALTAIAATDTQAAAFMKLGDIKGEATDNEHKDWIVIESISTSISRPSGEGATGAARRRGAAVLEDVVCVKELDKSSPKIMEYISSGKVLPNVEIHFTRNAGDGRATYYKYELTNVLVTSYNVSVTGKDGNETTYERFSLNFEEIKVTYTENDSKGGKKGNVEYTWKVEEGVK